MLVVQVRSARKQKVLFWILALSSTAVALSGLTNIRLRLLEDKVSVLVSLTSRRRSKKKSVKDALILSAKNEQVSDSKQRGGRAMFFL